jgi:acyl dehydratase
MAPRTLPTMPGLAGLYARALAGGLPLVGGVIAGPGASEPPTLRVDGIAVDSAHLRAYQGVCGFRPTDRLPATYPQTVAFPLVLALLTDPAFPFGAMGTVHIGNSITYDRFLTTSDVLDYEVAAGAPTPHPRGRRVVVEIVATTDGERVWEADMELLRREPAGRAPADTDGSEPDLPDEAPAGPARWQLSSDLGRRYAAVSGDRNPIHLTDLTAKPFGFSRHIAHGMWTHARALAELDNRLPDAYAVEVAFKKPVPLPGTVFFGARVTPGADEHIDFGLTSRPTDPGCSPTTHLLGRVRPR